MKKPNLKELYFEMVATVPERAFLELNKQVIGSICIYIFLVVMLLFSRLWGLAGIMTVMYIVYFGILFYEMYLFKIGEIEEIQGTCTAIDKDSLPYIRNYIIVATGTQAYKVILNKKKQVTLGSDILIYARKSTITEHEAYLQVSTPLMLFVTKIATKA